MIENPEKWSKSLILVPKTEKTGDFTVAFPIDWNYLTEVSDAIAKETGAGGMQVLDIKADVHTIAQTDLGTIDEMYSQTLEGKLEGNTLVFGKELSQSKFGSVGSTTASQNPRGGLIMPWLAGLIVALIVLAYFGWNQAHLKPALSAVDAEAARARRKYRQIMADVVELPEVKAGEIVIVLSSLDDLVKIADDLVKPVLHKVEEQRHIYCVAVGAVRYQYISQSQEA